LDDARQEQYQELFNNKEARSKFFQDLDEVQQRRFEVFRETQFEKKLFGSIIKNNCGN